MFYLKINNKKLNIPQLDNKIAAISIEIPIIDYNSKRTPFHIRPYLWTIFDPIPLKADSYDLFKDTLGETIKSDIDYAIEAFNDKLSSRRIPTVDIINEFTINGTQYIVIQLTKTSRAILMLGRRSLYKQNNIYTGKDGYFWYELDDNRRLSKVIIRKIFNLTNDEADDFMIKYRLKK